MFDRKRIQAFRDCFNSDAGKLVLHYLAKETGAYAPTHQAGDSHQTAFNEGRRAVYNHIITVMAANPELLEMIYKQQESNQQLQQMLRGE